jgi:hypothetical protein
MPRQSHKTLGQSAPAATTNTDIYTVPANTQAIVSTLAICNRGASTTYRVAVRPAGATLVNQHYIVYDSLAEQNNTVFLTLGIALAATDRLTVYAGTANLSFSAFGVEIA